MLMQKGRCDVPIHYRAGYKYQLMVDYSIQTSIKATAACPHFVYLHDDGTLVIKEGYAWDGPSGPVPDVPSAMRASLVHDALYELMRCGGLDHCHKDEADRLLRDICIEDGMMHFPAETIYEGVHLFGKPFTEANHEAPILVAGED
jgi:hypothetical protein